MINEFAFRRLCSAAGTYLELRDPAALSEGDRVNITGVATEIFLNDALPGHATLLLELGSVKPQHKIDVYEAVLAMQGLLHGTHDCLFDYDGIDDKLLFRASLPLSDETTPADLASVIELFVQQVRDWRETLMGGCIAEGDPPQVMTSGARLQRHSLSLA